MVVFNAGFSRKYREQIKNFCLENDMVIKSIKDFGNNDYYHISCESKMIAELENYINKLEK